MIDMKTVVKLTVRDAVIQYGIFGLGTFLLIALSWYFGPYIHDHYVKGNETAASIVLYGLPLAVVFIHGVMADSKALDETVSKYKSNYPQQQKHDDALSQLAILRIYVRDLQRGDETNARYRLLLSLINEQIEDLKIEQFKNPDKKAA